MSASFLGLSWVVLGFLTPARPLAGQDARDAPLVERLRHTAQQLLEDDDEPAVRVEDTEEEREVAIVGIVSSPVSMERALPRLERIERLFDHSPFVSQLGSIEDALAPYELNQLRLSEDQAELLSECEVGSCKFKLPREALSALGRVDWSGPGSMAARAGDLLAGFLADCLADYMAHGNRGLPVYHDKGTPLAAADGYDDLVRGAQHLFEHDDDLHQHMRSGPEPPPGGASRFFWMVEDYGLRPVITVNQAVLRVDQSAHPEWGRLVIKQIYGSHYLQAAIRSLDLVSAPNSNGELWVMLHGRFRFDTEVAGLSRGLLERRLQGVWTEQLEAIADYLLGTDGADAAREDPTR